MTITKCDAQQLARRCLKLYPVRRRQGTYYLNGRPLADDELVAKLSPLIGRRVPGVTLGFVMSALRNEAPRDQPSLDAIVRGFGALPGAEAGLTTNDVLELLNEPCPLRDAFEGYRTETSCDVGHLLRSAAGHVLDGIVLRGTPGRPRFWSIETV
jgi:hypothetical protein